MSKTPRTDEKEFKLYDESLSRPCSVVRSSFARQLEAELAELKADRVAVSQQLSDALDTLFASNKQLAEARAEIERLKGVVISQITPEPFVLSSYSTSTEPAKYERDKLIEQMREALQWYKDQVSSCNRNGDAGELARDRLAKDVGKRAAAALVAERGE